MSVAAIPIYNALVEQGMPPERAQEAAEAAAEAQRKALEEVARKAEKFTERKVVESEKTLRGEMAVAAERAAAQAERAAAQTEQVRRDAVTRDEFHQRNAEVATRGEMHAEFADVRKEMRDEFAKTNAQIDALRTELRAELRAINSRFDQLHRLIIALLVIFGGGMATLVGLAARFVFSI